jgi:site-specific recombinase XerD
MFRGFLDTGSPEGKHFFVRPFVVAGRHAPCLTLTKQGVVRLAQLKNRQLLHLPLSWPLVKALADYLQNERPRLSPYRHLFLGRTAPRRPLTPSSVAEVMARRMRQAGVRASGHQLRHAFASELLRVGTPYSTLQELLGHTHISSTQVYTKIDLTQLREVADNDGEDY